MDKTRRFAVAEALGYFIHGHSAGEHLLGQGLPDLARELPERGSFGGEVSMEGARRLCVANC